MKFTDKIRSLFRRISRRIKRLAGLIKENIVNTAKSIWRNAESVAILTLGSLGTAHFVGSYVFENPALASLFFAELIGPVVAIGVIWGLLRLASFRRNRRQRRAQAVAF